MALTQISTDGIKNGTITGSDLATNIDLADNQKLRIGTSNDLLIWHGVDGSENSYIIQQTSKHLIIKADSALQLRADTLNLWNHSQSKRYIACTNNSSVDLYFNNSKKFETTTAGGTLTGDFTVTGNIYGGNHITIQDSDGSSDMLKIGTDEDIRIYHYNNNSYIRQHTDKPLTIGGTSTGQSLYLSPKDGEYAAIFKPNAEVELYYDNVKQFETISTGFKSIAAGNRRITIGSTDASGAMLVLDGDSNGDGSGNDYAFIQHNTDGEIQIENYKSAAIRFATAGIDRYKIDASGHLLPAADSTYNIGSNSVRVANGYFDTLYGDGSNLTGVTSTTINSNADNRIITGSGTANTLNGESSLTFNGTTLAHTGSSFSIDGTDTNASNSNCFIQFNAGKINLHADQNNVAGGTASGVTFNADGTYVGKVTATGFIPATNNTFDLGATGTRWRNIYTNDLNLSNKGGSNDVDGTWGSYTIQEGEESLFLINRRNGKKYKFNLTEVS